ncbi:Hsp70 family protein [Solwaraspora sp. WMMD791]|uniref:Hsp70 family protein n=1 Tax=Solwaraspora sp. WMMD791 TaxID=3016086 RepID=UPI00249C4BDC|nr:Hsp70 family protein [Solwaraspora sp. WMMD791]WFE29283.1 Hsp70 family protein [Solwaraspora sp. WMMD791]
MAGWTLGVDIGTSYTTTGVGEDGRIEVVEVDGVRRMPSTVAVDDDSRLVAGRRAQRIAERHPDRAEQAPRRALVAGPGVLLGDRAYPATELVATLLRHCARYAVHRQGRRPVRTVLSCPAGWTAVERDLLTAAAVQAGLPDPELVAEPVAAAVACVDATVATDGPVAVYDLGGRTLDTAVLEWSGHDYRLVGEPGGDPHLGGADFDEELVRILGDYAQQVDAERWLALVEGAGPDRSLLWAEVIRTKEGLSRTPVQHARLPGFVRQIRVVRGEFESAIAHLLVAGADELRRTIDAAVPGGGELAAVCLTGGSSRIPAVAETLVRITGQQRLVLAQPHQTVVHGALRWAASAGRSRVARSMAAATPAPDSAPIGTPPERPVAAASLSRQPGDPPQLRPPTPPRLRPTGRGRQVAADELAVELPVLFGQVSRYLVEVSRFCLGREAVPSVGATPERVLGQLAMAAPRHRDEWQAFAARLRALSRRPVVSGAEVSALIAECDALMADIDEFVGATYRVLPLPPVPQPVDGLLRRTVRAQSLDRWAAVDAYLADVVAFCASASVATETAPLVSSLSDWIPSLREPLAVVLAARATSLAVLDAPRGPGPAPAAVVNRELAAVRDALVVIDRAVTAFAVQAGR